MSKPQLKTSENQNEVQSAREWGTWTEEALLIIELSRLLDKFGFGTENKTARELFLSGFGVILHEFVAKLR